MLTAKTLRLIERMALDGKSERRIAQVTKVPHLDVHRAVVASPVVREQWAERAESQRQRDDARRRLTRSDIGRASSTLFLASKRDALGHIDWDAVHGYVSFHELAEQAALDEAHARPAP